jgi:hypothetical protein
MKTAYLKIKNAYLETTSFVSAPIPTPPRDNEPAIVRSTRKRRARGQNAILDRNLSTILAAVAIVGVLAAYFLSSANSNAQAQQNQVASIAAEVDNLYGSQSNYTGLTTNSIALTGALSPQWVNGKGAAATLVSIFRSTIVLAPVANPYTGLANGAWTLTLPNVPPAACNSLATTLVGSGELGLSINGVGAPVAAPVAGTSPLPAPAAAQAACNAGANTLVFFMT